MIDKVRTEKIKRGDKISPLVLLTLCLTAVTLSTPLNGLSPGMSVIAKEFGFTEKQRDHYLGGYISLVTMIGQIIGSCLSGSLNFWLSRKTILELCLLIGSLSMLITSFSPNFVVLVFPRIFLGCCQGAVIPPLFSLVGDFYSPDERAVISAILSSCLGGGMMIGQLFCGFMLNWIGWRAPFAILSACSGCTISLVHYLVREPAVGSAEEDLHEVFQKGLKLPQLSIPTFLESLAIPTVLIMILQTIPNTIPWGVLSSHLHDFLATDEKLGMQEATSLIGIFGIGAAFGGLSGGCIGGRVYIANRALLPIFMGLTMASSALLLKDIITYDLSASSMTLHNRMLLFLSGALAAINGANIRFIILNVTTPEARGATIAVLNLTNCLGRGIGPSIADLYMRNWHLKRKDGIEISLNFWLVASVLMMLAYLTVIRDEDRLKSELRRFAKSLDI